MSGVPGMLRAYWSKLVKHGLTGAQEQELDPIRSEYPFLATMHGIYSAAGGASAVLDSFGFTVPSGHVFQLKHLAAAASCDAGGKAWLYDSPGTSQPRYFVQFASIPVSFPMVVINDIHGVYFESIPCLMPSVDVLSALFCRIGGIIREKRDES